MASTTDWAWLPELVLNLILQKLQGLPACVRFASVCTSWNSAPKSTQFPVPLLLIPTLNNIYNKDQAKTLLHSVQEDKTYALKFPSSPDNIKFCGSSHGWLVFVRINFSLTLISPTPNHPQQASIHLPPISMNGASNPHGVTFSAPRPIYRNTCQHCVRKVVLSHNPTTCDQYNVAAIYGSEHNLAVLKSGDRQWTYLNKSNAMFSDALWHKNDLYAVTCDGVVMCIDGVLSMKLRASIVCPFRPSKRKMSDRDYLVESSRGELLLIESSFGYSTILDGDRGYRVTSKFKVYKVEMSHKVEVKEVGGDALFLGDCCSSAVEASGMCRKNCIYFINATSRTNLTPNLSGMANGMDTFCLETGKSVTHYIADPSLEFLTPIWITPLSLEGWF